MHLYLLSRVFSRILRFTTSGRCTLSGAHPVPLATKHSGAVARRPADARQHFVTRQRHELRLCNLPASPAALTLLLLSLDRHSSQAARRRRAVQGARAAACFAAAPRGVAAARRLRRGERIRQRERDGCTQPFKRALRVLARRSSRAFALTFACTCAVAREHSCRRGISCGVCNYGEAHRLHVKRRVARARQSMGSVRHDQPACTFWPG
eukprot:2859929-Pleurochrysis_carterae.AAC.4